jgi:hypothetical protein
VSPGTVTLRGEREGGLFFSVDVAWTWDLDLELETGGIGCCSVQGQRADCNTWEYEVITTLMPVSMLVLCSLARWSCSNCVATTNYY